jgi:hypothetical protein
MGFFMADFSTWSSLLTALRNAIANRDLAVKSYKAPDGTYVEYRTFDELIRLEAWVADKASGESATSGQPIRRVHVAIQGDSW